jgi:two-component system copper resistance phosphate regulon response regulator CusR
MRILLVEDEPDAARVLAKALREQSYAVDVAPDGEAALKAVSDATYAAIVLDVRLPLRDGLSVCRQLRADDAITPVLMVTARDTVDARIEGLDAGTDDYLTKPFDLGELLARLRAIIRRGARQPLPAHLSVGPITLDTRTRQVTRHGRPVSLTAREYALLEYFARRPGDLITRADIAEHVWDASYEPGSNVIDVYIQRLRRKLDDGREDSIIRTRRGEGYQMVEQKR